MILYDTDLQSREEDMESLNEMNAVADYEETGKLNKLIFKLFCSTLQAVETRLLSLILTSWGLMEEVDENYYAVSCMALPMAEPVDE